MHHHTSTNVNFKLVTPFESKTLNISCINLRLQQLQVVVIINRHCHQLSDAILNGQPRTARSTQTSCGELSEFTYLEGYREGREKGKKTRQAGMGGRNSSSYGNK